MSESFLTEKILAAVSLISNLPGGGGRFANTLGQYLGRLFPWVIGFIAVLAVVMLAWGGLKYMFSGIPGIKTEAKEQIWAAIFGLLLALASYLILKTINPAILNF